MTATFFNNYSFEKTTMSDHEQKAAQILNNC